MRTLFLIGTLLLMGASNPEVACAASSKVAPGWVNDGARSCEFYESVRATTCTQYHRTVEHRTNGGKSWVEWRYMWKAPGGREVHYTSRIGALGIGPFTIGELFDSGSTILPGHASHQAVSYAPSKDELVIGVPAEGYTFSVNGCCV